ncbi:MAG: SLC13 family permease [Azonexus sp.]
MNSDLLIVLLLLGAAIVMFAANRPRVDAVALLAMVALPFTGVITVNEALAGFANPNIVLIGAMFVIGEALARAGVARRIGDWLATRGGNQPWRQLAALMLTVGLLGSVMSSTGVVAMFIPVVMRIAGRTGIAPSQLMMPMAYAALVSGMLTLVATSPNLVINYELVRHGAEGFNFFSFTPFGVPILLLSIIYMHFARRWLRADSSGDGLAPGRPKIKKWVKRYQLAGREIRVRVLPGSPLLQLPIGKLNLTDRIGVRLILIERGTGRDRRFLTRSPHNRIQAHDVLLLDLDRPSIDVAALCEEFKVDLLPASGRYFIDRSRDVGMAEVIIPENSRFARKTVAEAELLNHAELTVVGVRRGKTAREPFNVREVILKVGDTLLLAGPWANIRQLQEDSRDLVVLNLPREFEDVLPAASKAPYAVLTLAAVIAMMATGIVPNVHAALIGCLMMGFFKCINLDQAYSSIHLKSLIMIVGMMPFAMALERTGGVDMAAHALVGLTANAGTYGILALLFTITATLGLFIVGTANAVLMIPIALAIADELQASPYPFAMIVALAASSAFMTPISPINTLVATAGNYSFADFLRIGLPLTLIVMVVSVIMVPWFFAL